MLNECESSPTPWEPTHLRFAAARKPFLSLLPPLRLPTLDNIVAPLPPPGRGALDEPLLFAALLPAALRLAPALAPTNDPHPPAAPPRPASEPEPRLAGQGPAQGVETERGLGGAGRGLVSDGAQRLDAGGLGDGLDGADEAELGAEGGEEPGFFLRGGGRGQGGEAEVVG